MALCTVTFPRCSERTPSNSLTSMLDEPETVWCMKRPKRFGKLSSNPIYLQPLYVRLGKKPALQFHQQGIDPFHLQLHPAAGSKSGQTGYLGDIGHTIQSDQVFAPDCR